MLNKYVFLEEITKWTDEGSPVGIIYLDFQKAFNKMPHQRLLLKLSPWYRRRHNQLVKKMAH